jgi:hypothetical protein
MARRDLSDVPHHVYRCFDSTGRLIYVGASGDLFARLRSHRASSWWAPQVAKVTAKVYPNRLTARAAERAAIRAEMPRWNKSGKWETRHQWTQEDWIDWLTVLFQASRYPAPEIYARLRDYRALWNVEAPAVLLAQLASMEAEHKAVREETARRVADHKARVAEVEREDELALAREHKARLALGAPDGCSCAPSALRSGRTDLYCDYHNPESEALL